MLFFMIPQPSKRLRRALGLLGLCVLVAAGCGGGSVDTSVATSSLPEAISPAPTVELAPAESSLIVSTVSGGQINFGSLEGHDVVLWFWAPW